MSARYRLRRFASRELMAGPLVVVLCAIGLLALPPHAHADPLPGTSIAINGADTGRTFDGIGAISGGGGNSRLLTDYPPAQRNAILDYLFKPGFGANLQILKIETSGDGNTTSGAEQTIEETRGEINCQAGYEFWLAKQALQRNRHIVLYGLTWSAPGWVGSSMYSQNGIQYLLDWLGCARQQGLSIGYLGGWNEKGGWSNTWWEDLRTALDQHGFSGVKLVAADQTNSFSAVGNAMSQDQAFADAVSVIGEHYPCGWNGPTPISKYSTVETSCPSTATAQALNKPLWASEQGSMNYSAGGLPMARANNIDYLDGKMTASINWPLVASPYSDVGFADQGLVLADQPWSGAYDVGLSTWVTAHTTQFTQPGWQYLDGASGYLAGQSSDQDGSYVSLKSPNGHDWSSIIETTRASGPQTVTLNVSGGLSAGTVHVWRTSLTSGDRSEWFAQGPDLTLDATGSASMTLQPNYIYSFTTTSGQGKGNTAVPANHPLQLPYADQFNSETRGQQARYLANMEGAFTVERCADRAGSCVQLDTPTKPLEWGTVRTPYPYTVGGGEAWSNYQVSADVRNAKPGAAGILGRQSNLGGTVEDPSQVHYYSLTLSDTGVWSINLADGSGNAAVSLASGTVASAAGLNTWHNLALTFDGSLIVAAVDGVTVGSVTDTSLGAGKVGFVASGYLAGDQYGNLRVSTLTDPAVPVALPTGVHNTDQVTNVPYSSVGTGVNQWQYQGSWLSGGGNTWSDTAGDTATLTFQGDGVALQAMTYQNQGIVAVSVDGGAPTDVDLYRATSKQALTTVFSRTGLDPAVQHTLVVTVTNTKNPAAGGTWASVAAAQVLTPLPAARTPAITAPDQSQIHPGRNWVSGTADPGELITVSVDGNPVCVNAAADSDGHWICAVTLQAGSRVITAVGADPVTGVLSQATAPLRVLVPDD